MAGDSSGHIESLLSKTIRHIRTGDFRPTTLQSGVVQFTHWLGSRGCEAGRLDDIQCTENFGNIAGLVVTRMPMRVFIEFMRLNEPSFVDFPTTSRLGIVVKGNNTDTAVSVSSSFQQSSGALAEFTGPTFGKFEDRINHLLPNNGFWLRDCSMMNPFRDTSNSGQMRRGAFALRANGELNLVDDEKKHQIVRSNFRGYTALVGTSYFMSSHDSNEAVAKEKESSEISYLVLYEGTDGASRFCFSHFPYTTRQIARSVIDIYARSRNAASWRAVELERVGATCLLRTKEGEYTLGGASRRNERLDHYQVLLR